MDDWRPVPRKGIGKQIKEEKEVKFIDNTLDNQTVANLKKQLKQAKDKMIASENDAKVYKKRCTYLENRVDSLEKQIAPLHDDVKAKQ